MKFVLSLVFGFQRKGGAYHFRLDYVALCIINDIETLKMAEIKSVFSRVRNKTSQPTVVLQCLLQPNCTT